jgi:hypothetical protein
MRITHIHSVYLIGLATLILSGCGTPPLRSGQTLLSNPFTQKPIGETIKEEQKSIAVTNIFYRKEGANLKYVEEISNKYDSNGASPSTPIPLKELEKPPVESKATDNSDVFADAQSSAFPIKFTNPADFKPSDHPSIQKELEARLGKTSTESTPSPSQNTTTVTTQQTKKSGYETKAEYGQLRTFSAAIRGLLIKAGYKVVQANPAAQTNSQGDEFFHVVERIKAGEFNSADYVMFGVLGEMSFTDNSEGIVGTKSTSQQIGLDLIVDFSLIDTKTYQVVASFLAEGNGKEIRIDGKGNGFKPSMAKLMKQASTTLAEDVAKHLADQNFVTSTIAEPEIGRNYKRKPYDDDSSTLKMYTK